MTPSIKATSKSQRISLITLASQRQRSVTKIRITNSALTIRGISSHSTPHNSFAQSTIATGSTSASPPLLLHIMDFEYNSNPGRVIFGRGTIKKLPAELERQKLKAPLILSTPEQVSQANDLKTILNGQVAGVFNNATMHTPTNVTDTAVEYATAQGADCVVSIGGGSTTGLGKAISIRTGLPHISIPTTYAGSEMTPILGETADGVKKTRSDPKILPGTVIYDVDLTMTLPVGMSAVSGVNAIAHAGRSLYVENHLLDTLLTSTIK